MGRCSKVRANADQRRMEGSHGDEARCEEDKMEAACGTSRTSNATVLVYLGWSKQPPGFERYKRRPSNR